MKAIILCGGLGTRLSEETQVKPKPMVEVGGMPILWHIMRGFARHGIRDFVLALGYKGEVIKDYFLNYHPRQSDITVHTKSGRVDYSNPAVEDWSVNLVDTGANSQTGGRLLRLRSLLQSEERFMVTYGDGVGNVDLQALLAFHRSHGRKATVTAVRPPARFGDLVMEGSVVTKFAEKPQGGEGWISGGFFVFERSVLDYIENDTTILERGPLERLTAEGQLMAHHHYGYWQPMDTLRDKNHLESLWASGNPPWVTE